MTPRDDDHSLENEPHWRGDTELDTSEETAGSVAPAPGTENDDRALHSVWDEPALSPELADTDRNDRITYTSWLREHIATTSLLTSWSATLLAMAGGGVWAIIGSFMREYSSGIGGEVLGVILVAPLVEEGMKVALPLVIVETRPYLFKSGIQIALCALAGGAAFGTIENLIYLEIYIPDASESIRWVRWTFCLGGHTLWSGIAGIGIWRMWRKTIVAGSHPDMTVAAPWLITAMVLHGIYNTVALVLLR